MKKIILLATGGTIACVPGADGLAPGVTAAQLLARTPQLNRLAEMTGRDVFSLDSSNIQPEEWRVLARAARDALNESHGVVITHGTDTLAYSAAALSFMLRAPKAPVVLTGSQLPLEHPLSDAPSNLAEAVETARTAPPGEPATTRMPAAGAKKPRKAPPGGPAPRTRRAGPPPPVREDREIESWLGELRGNRPAAPPPPARPAPRRFRPFYIPHINTASLFFQYKSRIFSPGALPLHARKTML